MDLILNKLKEQGFELEIKTDDISEYCCICNPDLVSRSYEELGYSFIDSYEEVFGFFITKDKIIYASCVVDLQCNSACSKIREEVNKYTNEIFTNYAEISLLCSNFKHRIKGLAALLLDYVKLWIKKNYNKNFLVLTVANINKNANAVQFYENMKFERINNIPHFLFLLK